MTAHWAKSLSVWFYAFWVASHAAVASVEPVLVTPDAVRVAAWSRLSVFQAERPDLTPQQAAELMPSARLPAVDSPERIMGRGVRPWWARFSLRNAGSVPLTRLISLESTTQHSVRLFRQATGGDWQLLPTMADQAGRQLASGSSYPLWPLSLEPGETIELMLRIEGPAVVRFPVFVIHPSSQDKWTMMFYLAIGVTIGVCLLVCLYVIYWHRYLDDASVLLFAVMLSADLAGALWLSGFFSALLPMFAEESLSTIGLAAYAVLYGCGSLHARIYLKTAAWSPATDRLLRWMGWSWLFVSPWCALAFPVAARVLMVWGGAVVALVLVLASLRAATRKVPFSEFIAAAWLSYLVVGLTFLVARVTEDPRFWSSSALVLAQPTLVAILFGIAMNQKLLANRDHLIAAHSETLMQREHANRLMHERSLLFAAMNHDLRQPLLGVGMYASMLKSAADPGRQAELSAKLDSALREVDDLMAGIQQLALAHETNHQPAMETRLIDELLAPVIDEYRQQAYAKRITIRYVPSRLSITTHAPYFLRIVRNLLSNTLRYTGRGGRVVVGVRRGGGLRLLVADNGQGMNEEQTRRAFEAFTRFDAQAAIPQGSGLGLFSVRTLATGLGMQTALHSVPGRGSCFTLSLLR